MFRKYFLPILLFLSSVHFSSGHLYAQEEDGEIITISERVGNEIDQEERDKYGLFKGIEGFQSAVFLKLPDNSYVLEITHQDEITGELKIERIKQSEQSMKGHRNYIDHFEEIQAREQPIKQPILKTDFYQEPGTAFFLELGGKPFLSLNVDFRINKSNRFSVGINVADLPFPNLMYYHLSGEKYSKFEVGVGVTPIGLLFGRDDTAGGPPPAIFHGVLGYRYQKKNGRLFRIGFTPAVWSVPMYPTLFLPMFGISFGYSR